MARLTEWANFLAQEDENIEVTRAGLEGALTEMMDQILSNYERTQQLTEPNSAATSTLVDSLSLGWSLGTEQGEEYISNILTKADLRGVLTYVTTYGAQRARLITSTTARQMRDGIIRRQRQGLTPSEIAREMITQLPALAATRAKIIATTEVHSATQFAMYNASLRSGQSVKKRWITVEDDRVRNFGNNAEFSHLLMHDERTALTSMFRVPHRSGSYEPLRFAGDPEGSAGNIINCRCITAYEPT